MNYIILDLEWNTALDKVSGKYVNEIIEVGAVKLNDKLKEVDRFSSFVSSRLTSKLSGRFKNLTGISNEDMLGGNTFEEVMSEFKTWAGKNTITLTWSTSDIYTLYDNFHTFMGLNSIPCITKYVDLQKYAQAIFLRDGFDINNQISLSTAADMLEIDYRSLALHRAVDDSRLTATIFRSVYEKRIFKEFIIDTNKKDFYKKLTFKPYIISDINNPKINRKVMYFTCDKCGRRVERVSPWRFKGKSFRSDFVCSKCKDGFTGCITFKNCFDKVSVKKYKVRAKTLETANK